MKGMMFDMKKTNRIILIISSFLLLFNLLYSNVYADDIDEESFNSEEFQEIIETSFSPTKEPILNSKAAIIYDRNSHMVLWGKNQYSKRPMASTTKIMTAIVVLENSNLSDIVTVSKKAANTGGSRLKLKENDKISVNDLLYGLMLKSRK